MEKSTKYGLGMFILLVVGGIFFVQNTGIKSSGGSGEIVEITTTLEGFKYSPDTINVVKGSKVKLTIQNKDDVNHGLHLPQFGIVEGIPPRNVKIVEFIAVETPSNGQVVPTCSQEHGEVLTFNII